MASTKRGAFRACTAAAIFLINGFAPDLAVADEVNSSSAGSIELAAPSSEATELDPIIVTGKSLYLYDSDRQLDRIKDALPGLGTEAAARKDLVETLSKFYEAHKDPNDLRPEEQALILKLMGKNDDRLP